MLKLHLLKIVLLASTLVLTAVTPITSHARGQQGLDAAISQVQNQTGGRVLKAYQKGQVYIIKVLMPSGVVKTFRVSAR